MRWRWVGGGGRGSALGWGGGGRRSQNGMAGVGRLQSSHCVETRSTSHLWSRSPQSVNNFRKQKNNQKSGWGGEENTSEKIHPKRKAAFCESAKRYPIKWSPWASVTCFPIPPFLRSRGLKHLRLKYHPPKPPPPTGGGGEDKTNLPPSTPRTANCEEKGGRSLPVGEARPVLTSGVAICFALRAPCEMSRMLVKKRCGETKPVPLWLRCVAAFV